MDKRLAELVREAYKILKDSADEGVDDMLDVIKQAENSEDIIVRSEWTYLLGIADALNLTISQTVEEANEVLT